MTILSQESSQLKGFWASPLKGHSVKLPTFFHSKSLEFSPRCSLQAPGISNVISPFRNLVFHLHIEGSHLTFLALLCPKIQKSLDSTFKKQRLQNGFLWGIIYIQWHTPVFFWVSLHKCLCIMPCNRTQTRTRNVSTATKYPSRQLSTQNQPLIWFLSLQVSFACFKMPCPQNCALCISLPGFLC